MDALDALDALDVLDVLDAVKIEVGGRGHFGGNRAPEGVRGCGPEWRGA